MVSCIATASAKRLRRWPLNCFAVLVLMLAPAQTSPAQEVPGIACALAVHADTGRVHTMLDLPGGGVLILAEKGWFLARVLNGAVTVAPVAAPDKAIFEFTSNAPIHNLPGGGVLILAEGGWVLVRTVDGAVTVAPVGTADTGPVSDINGLPGGEMLIVAEKGWFLARVVNGTVTVAPVGAADTGDVFATHDLPDGGVLIGAEKGLFLARVVNGAVTVAPVVTADTGDVFITHQYPDGFVVHRFTSHDFPGGGMLIGAEKGLFLARAVNGAVTVAPVGAADTGDVFAIHDFPGGGVLIAGRRRDCSWRAR